MPLVPCGEFKCDTCGSDKIFLVEGEMTFLFDLTGRIDFGSVQKEFGIGSGQKINFHYCISCGKIQGKFLQGADL